MKVVFTSAILIGFTVLGFAQKRATFSINKKEVTVYTTVKGTTAPMLETKAGPFTNLTSTQESAAYVFIDPTKTFQTFLGIGGAITDASAETYYKLPKDKQEELLTAYYDREKGIGYTLARTNMNSCDFSSSSYTYVKEHDSTLQSFSIKHDEQYKIPLIKAALRKSGGMPLFISPWSPPAWMKDNNNMLQGGKLKPNYYQSWANYYIRFMQSYQKAGIHIWGLTVQNEPMAVQPWESCIFSAEEERDFVKNYLGPTLKKSGMGDKKLIVWDHNRDLIYPRASTILSDQQAAKYVWGVGFHWYEAGNSGSMLFDNLRSVGEAFPGKNLFFTEGCNDSYKAERIGDWSLGEKYGHSMINDFNAGTVAWTDWNILLDEKGGPNHVGNYCFAPIHADTKSGALIYTNSYYYLGHFSKFIRPGARRIACSTNRAKLQNTAFLNQDGSIAVVVLNTTDESIKYQLCIGDQAVPGLSAAHSIATFVIGK